MLVAAAALFGLAGGYGWTVVNAPQPKIPPHPKTAFMPIPPSPEEQPAASDVQWAAEAEDSNVAAATGNRSANVEESP